MKKLISIFLFLFIGIAAKAQVTFTLSDTNITVCSGVSTTEFKYANLTGGLDSFLIVSATSFLNVAADAIANDSLFSISNIPTNPSNTSAAIYHGTIRAFNNNDTVDVAITVTVLPDFTAGSIYSESVTTCVDLHELQAVNADQAKGGDGNISYRWRNGNIIIPVNNPLLKIDTMSLSAGTYTFTREAKDNLCSGGWQSSDNTYTLKVYDTFTPGSISGGDTVCYQGNTNAIASQTDASGGDGKISYCWTRTHNNIVDTVQNATFNTYTPPSNQSGTFVYERLAKDSTCAADWVSSGTYTLTVLNPFNAGSIVESGDTICMSDFSYVDILNENIAIGGDSNISYRWLMNGNPIDSGTNSSFKVYSHTIGNTSGVYIFTREAKDTKCSNNWVSSGGSCTLTIYSNFDAGTISGNSTVCFQGTVSIGSNADATGGDGKITYLWTKEHQNNIDTIQGAELSTYTTISSNESGTFVYERFAKDSTCTTDWVSSGTYTLTVSEKICQTINFDTIPEKVTIGDADFALNAAASSGLEVTFTSSDTTIAEIINNAVHIKKAGTTDITAEQLGDSIYFAATPVTQTLTVEKKEQTINFAPLANVKENDADFSPEATASSGLDVSYTSSNPSVATIVNNQIHIIAKGTTTITAEQSGNEEYKAATPISQTLTVEPNVSVTDLQQQSCILYPNPVKDILHIKSSSDIEKITVYDISGRMLQTFEVSKTSKVLKVSHLAKGIYFARVMIDGKELIYKFVKE